MRVVILSNRDPTANALFQAVCARPDIEVALVSFSATLTKSKSFAGGVLDIYRRAGLGYFLYVCFWDAVFLAKDWLVRRMPWSRHLFPGFFSLWGWAAARGVPVTFEPDYNDPVFVARVRGLKPDVVLTRMNQIVKAPLLQAAPQGCWCLHSSELPRYQGVAAEFHSLLNGEARVGFTVFRMEAKLDAGPLIRQHTIPIAPGITMHGLIQANVTAGKTVIGQALDDLAAGALRFGTQPSEGKSYHSWPSPAQTRAFRRKGLRYLSLGEAWRYVFGP